MPFNYKQQWCPSIHNLAVSNLECWNVKPVRKYCIKTAKHLVKVQYLCTRRGISCKLARSGGKAMCHYNTKLEYSFPFSVCTTSLNYILDPFCANSISLIDVAELLKIVNYTENKKIRLTLFCNAQDDFMVYVKNQISGSFLSQISVTGFKASFPQSCAALFRVNPLSLRQHSH